MTQKILILDFGSQYTQLIARAVREANVYCEIVPYNKTFTIDENLKGIILSGSPFSVNDEKAPVVDVAAMNAQLPQSCLLILDKVPPGLPAKPSPGN